MQNLDFNKALRAIQAGEPIKGNRNSGRGLASSTRKRSRGETDDLNHMTYTYTVMCKSKDMKKQIKIFLVNVY